MKLYATTPGTMLGLAATFAAALAAGSADAPRTAVGLHSPRGAPSAAQAPSRMAGVIDSLVVAEALARGVPGVAVAVVSDGAVVVMRGYGTADVTTGRQVTAATPFNVASVTKPFTSALAMRLVAEGRIGLRDRVSQHLPWLPDRYRDITVYQLLSHTSGIARDLRLSNFDDPDQPTYRARLDSAAASAQPGERFEYSNTGYTVLGWLVAAVEGEPLGSVLRRRLFEPLEMRQARYRATPDDDPLRALPHAIDAGGESGAQPIDYLTGGFGSGGLSMSAADAAAFGVALQDGKFLAAELADSVWSPARLRDGSPIERTLFGEPASYGFGWFVARYAGRTLLTHGGGIEGYSANLYHFPEEQLTIVVLANVKGRDDGVAPVDPLARRIADACLARDACRVDPEHARLRREISTANRAFSAAYLVGDTAAIRALYASEALALMGGARTVIGARPVARLFEPPTRNRRIAHALYTERLVDHGGAVVEVGTWFDQWQNLATGETGAATGRYTLTWVTDDGGRRRIAVDAWVPADDS